MSDKGSDALAIANLKARYCLGSDTAAGDGPAARALFADMFTDDFSGDYGFEPKLDAGRIVDFLCTAIAGGSEWMVHMLHSPRIEIAGDEASGEWTVLVHSQRREGGERMVVIGRYSDVFRRTPAGWRIARIGFWRPG